MKQLIAINCILLLAAVATGCSESRFDRTIAELKKNNVELSGKLGEANKRIEKSETTLAALQVEMKTFRQGYDAKKREELAKNISAVKEMLIILRRDSKAGKATLEDIQGLKTKIEKLKDLCVKHESEARDANQIGQIKASVKLLKQSVSKIEGALRATPNIGS